MKLRPKVFGTVGRATVPAETGRHGGRPYDSTRLKFLFRFDWTLAAIGGALMKHSWNSEPQNIEGGFDIHYSIFDLPAMP